MDTNIENINTGIEENDGLEIHDAKEVDAAEETEASTDKDDAPIETESNDSEDLSVIGRAVAKIAEELKTFKGGNKETAVSKFVASTLTKFCAENERFAEVVCKTPRTLSDCCAEIMEGSGNAISDIDVYRSAVQSYFPNADIHFLMEITITGDAPTSEEINREPKKKLPKPRAPRQTNAKPEESKSAVKSPKKPAAAPPNPTPVKSAASKKPKIETLQLTLF